LSSESFNGSNPSTTENAAQTVCVPAAIEVSVSVDDGARSARKGREPVELEMTFENYPIRDVPTEGGANLPKRR